MALEVVALLLQHVPSWIKVAMQYKDDVQRKVSSANLYKARKASASSCLPTHAKYYVDVLNICSFYFTPFPGAAWLLAKEIGTGKRYESCFQPVFISFEEAGVFYGSRTSHDVYVTQLDEVFHILNGHHVPVLLAVTHLLGESSSLLIFVADFGLNLYIFISYEIANAHHIVISSLMCSSPVKHNIANGKSWKASIGSVEHTTVFLLKQSNAQITCKCFKTEKTIVNEHARILTENVQ